jgi:HEAT repeat protein
VYGFQKLGAAAKDAVPALVEICEQNLSGLRQETAPAALGHIGPAAKKAIPVLLRCATNTGPMVRGNAIYALGQIQGEPELVVPLLLKSLHDPDPGVRGDAAFSVGAFGTRQAIPTLLELLDDPLEWTREQAAEALKKIDPAAARKAGVKCNSPDEEWNRSRRR